MGCRLTNWNLPDCYLNIALPIYCDINGFIAHSNERIGMVMMFEKHPLFLFIIIMVVAILYKQFDAYTVVQNNGDIVQSIDFYRCYRATYYNSLVLFYPFIYCRHTYF